MYHIDHRERGNARKTLWVLALLALKKYTPGEESKDILDRAPVPPLAHSLREVLQRR